MQPDEVKTGIFGDAEALQRIAVCIKHRKLDPTEVEGVAHRPDDCRDPGAHEVERTEAREPARARKEIALRPRRIDPLSRMDEFTFVTNSCATPSERAGF